MRTLTLAGLLCLACGLTALATTELYSYANGTLAGLSGGQIFLQGGIFVAGLTLEERFESGSGVGSPTTTFSFDESIYYDEASGQWILHRNCSATGGYGEWNRVSVHDSSPDGQLDLEAWNRVYGDGSFTVSKDGYLDAAGQYGGWSLNASGATAVDMSVDFVIELVASGVNVPLQHYSQAWFGGSTDSLPAPAGWPWSGILEGIGFYVYPGDSPALSANQTLHMTNESFSIWGNAFLGPDSW